VVFPLVPKLWLGEGLTEAGASAQLCSQAGAWEQEAKDLHPSTLQKTRSIYPSSAEVMETAAEDHRPGPVEAWIERVET
jgi:hypothetical protein